MNKVYLFFILFMLPSCILFSEIDKKAIMLEAQNKMKPFKEYKEGDYIEVRLKGNKGTHGTFVKIYEDKVYIQKGKITTYVKRKNIPAKYRHYYFKDDYQKRVKKKYQKLLRQKEKQTSILAQQAKAEREKNARIEKAERKKKKLLSEEQKCRYKTHKMNLLLPDFSKKAEILIAPFIKSGQAFTVMGCTNLPEKTSLMITVCGLINQQTRVMVGNNGFFELRYQGNVKQIRKGVYSIEIILPYALTQSKKVVDIIGARGEHLKGKLVKNDASNGKYIKKEYSINLDQNGKYSVKETYHSPVFRFNSKATCKKRINQNINWYSGGTLHKATMKEWKNNTYQNRLATSADFLVKLMQMEGAKIPPVDKLKSAAIELERHISDSNSSGLADNQRVSEVAATVWVLIKAGL